MPLLLGSGMDSTLQPYNGKAGHEFPRYITDNKSNTLTAAIPAALSTIREHCELEGVVWADR